jgi:hypothetical protein
MTPEEFGVALFLSGIMGFAGLTAGGLVSSIVYASATGMLGQDAVTDFQWDRDKRALIPALIVGAGVAWVVNAAILDAILDAQLKKREKQ